MRPAANIKAPELPMLLPESRSRVARPILPGEGNAADALRRHAVGVFGDMIGWREGRIMGPADGVSRAAAEPPPCRTRRHCRGAVSGTGLSPPQAPALGAPRLVRGRAGRPLQPEPPRSLQH